MHKQPKHLIVRKIIWGIILFVGVVLLIISLKSFSLPLPDGRNNFIGYMLLMLSAVPLMICAGTLKWAFEAELDKMRKSRELYKKQQGKELESEFYSVDADVHSKSIKKRVKSAKQGLKNETCPKCGDVIDSDENFCSKCGFSMHIKCNKCGSVNEATDRFCRTCGNKLK